MLQESRENWGERSRYDYLQVELGGPLASPAVGPADRLYQRGRLPLPGSGAQLGHVGVTGSTRVPQVVAPAGREGALRRQPDVRCFPLPSCLESFIAQESRPLLPVKDRPLLLTSILTSEEEEAATWRPLLLPPCFFEFLFFFFSPISSLSSSSFFSFLPLFFFQSGRGIQGDTLILLHRIPDRKRILKTMVLMAINIDAINYCRSGDT